MAILLQNNVIINDNRELIGISTAGINTALYVGSAIQMDAPSGIITASGFAGSGANLTDIEANVIVSDGIPTGISTAEGDLYYDSGELRLFTYYSDQWIESSPIPPNATDLFITNGLGISTASVNLLLDTLTLEGEAGEIEVGINTLTNTLTFGLTNDVSIGGSMTATEYYGDGSKLTGLQVGAASSVTSEDNQDNSDYPMAFLSGVGVGVSVYTDGTTNEEFTYNPSTGTLKVKEFDSLSDARLKTDIVEIEDALSKVDSLRGVEYNWKNGSGASVGIIAQEVQEVYPQLVSDSGSRLTVNYNGLVGLLIAAVKELSSEVSDLKSQLK